MAPRIYTETQRNQRKPDQESRPDVQGYMWTIFSTSFIFDRRGKQAPSTFQMVNLFDIRVLALGKCHFGRR